MKTNSCLKSPFINKDATSKVMNFKQCIALICLSLCLFISSSQATFASNQCLSRNAFYNDTTLRCECDEGYAGLGDLCCDEEESYTHCHLGGDPWLTTYDGSQSPLYFPCVGRFSVINAKTRAGEDCVVEVMSTGHFVKHGAMYPDRTVISFNIKGTGRQIFKIVGATVQRPGETSVYTIPQLFRQRLNRMSIAGESFRIRYSQSRDIMSVSGCNTLVTFRPSTDQQAVQGSRPGICVRSGLTADKGLPSGDTTNGDLCSWSRSNLLPTEILPYSILYELIKDYQSIDAASRAIHPDYQAVCSNMENIVADKCTSDLVLSSSVYQCAPILYNADIRYCFDLEKVKGQQLVDLFNKCLNFQCSRDEASCKIFASTNVPLKACMPSFCNLYS